MSKYIPGVKDKNGAYLPPTPKALQPEDAGDISIDSLLKAGLQNIRGAMRAVTNDIGTGMPSRETIMNLKDLMTMLRDLKKEEQEFLKDLTDEELERLLKP